MRNHVWENLTLFHSKLFCNKLYDVLVQQKIISGNVKRSLKCDALANVHYGKNKIADFDIGMKYIFINVTNIFVSFWLEAL